MSNISLLRCDWCGFEERSEDSWIPETWRRLVITGHVAPHILAPREIPQRVYDVCPTCKPLLNTDVLQEDNFAEVSVWVFRQLFSPEGTAIEKGSNR